MNLKGFGKGLFGGSIILLVTINLFNALNYFFHFAMARMLTPADYGTLAALMAMLYIFNVSMESIQTIIAKYVSHEKSHGRIKNIIKKSLKKGFVVSILLFLVFLVVSIFISSFLRIEYSLVVLSGAMIFSVILLPINRGALQGGKKFNALGFNMVIEAVVKISLAILLVYLGWKVYGAILGVVLGTLLAFILSFANLKKVWRSREEKSDTSGIYHYSLPVFIVMVTIITFYSLDVILAKRFFPGDLAGQYAIASTLAKIIFFGTLPVSKAMFPISSRESLDGKPSRHILWKSIGILSILVVVALTIMYLFPELMVEIFSGQAHPEAVSILFYLAIATSLISFTNLILLYKLSLGKIKNYFLIPLFIVIEIIFLWLFHSNLREYSITLIFLNVIFLLGSIALFNKK